MSEVVNQTIASITGNGSELQTFELPQNYTHLINRLEQLALGLDSAFANLTQDRKAVEYALNNNGGGQQNERPMDNYYHHSHDSSSQQQGYSSFVSDIWVGIVLTLLIVAIIFFICSCFLYHKFQEWKNKYRTQSEAIEFCRNYPGEFVDNGEPTPSYTVVSGLPTYDDALDEFRKAGIILAPGHPTIKIIDNENKEKDGDTDNISVSSSSTCDADNTNTLTTHKNKRKTRTHAFDNLNFQPANGQNGQVIELTPEQLEELSKKKLSLQINFNNQLKRPTSNVRPRMDLRREVLRTRGVTNLLDSPNIHRSRSSSIGSLTNERSLFGRRMLYMEHRGSLV